MAGRGGLIGPACIGDGDPSYALLSISIFSTVSSVVVPFPRTLVCATVTVVFFALTP